MKWKQVALAFSMFILAVLAVILVNMIKIDDIRVLVLAGVTLVGLGVFAAFGFISLWNKFD